MNYTCKKTDVVSITILAVVAQRKTTPVGVAATMKKRGGVEIPMSTIQNKMRRLKEKGYITFGGEWMRTGESGPESRIWRITGRGQKHLKESKVILQNLLSLVS